MATKGKGKGQSTPQNKQQNQNANKQATPAASKTQDSAPKSKTPESESNNKPQQSQQTQTPTPAAQQQQVQATQAKNVPAAQQPAANQNKGAKNQQQGNNNNKNAQAQQPQQNQPAQQPAASSPKSTPKQQNTPKGGTPQKQQNQKQTPQPAQQQSQGNQAAAQQQSKNTTPVTKGGEGGGKKNQKGKNQQQAQQAQQAQQQQVQATQAKNVPAKEGESSDGGAKKKKKKKKNKASEEIMGERYPSVQDDAWVEVSGVRNAEGKAVNKRLKDVKDEADHLNKLVEDQKTKLAQYTSDLAQAQATHTEQSTGYKNKIAELEKELEDAQAASGKVVIVRNKDILSQRNYTTSERVMKVSHYNPKIVEGIVEAERYKREISSLNANIARLQHYLDSKSAMLSAAAVKEESKEEDGAAGKEGQSEEGGEVSAAEQKEETEKVSAELKTRIDELRKLQKISAGVIAQLEKDLSQSGVPEEVKADSGEDKQLRDLEEEERRLAHRQHEASKGHSESHTSAVEKASELIAHVQQELESTTKDIHTTVDAQDS